MRLFVSLLVVGTLAGVSTPEEEVPKGPFHGLEYRSIGPAAGGRVSRVTGVPGDPLTYYAATAAGGVWKSVDGGLEWNPIFADQPVSSIGSIAVAPSDPNVIWVGSGEANIRGNVAEGNGIYRSTDAGETWSHVWVAEGQIGTIVVDPKDPDTAYAAALGSPFGPTEERGVYRTRDGGRTWKRVLHVDRDTGASDVCLDPSNARILFAGTWQARRTPWDLTSGGPGSGLWISRDGGDSWKRLEGGGLPEGIWGRVGVRAAPSEPKRVYTLVEAEEGGLFRSDDGGGTWDRVSSSRGLRQRAWYYSTLTVDPVREDVVWFPQVSMLRTIDGGASIRSVDGGGWDYHDVWIDPGDRRRMIVGSDAGVSLSRDGGESWTRPPLPISQYYHISVDARRPYRVLGSLQDYGTISGPSRTLHDQGILFGEWYEVGGGEAGFVVADPLDPEVVWAGEYLGIITRWDGRLRRATVVSIYPSAVSGVAAKDLLYRFQWTAPIVVSPHDPGTVYHAGNVLFRTRDAGQTWEPISPDLTRDDESKQGWAGGPITGDNTGVEYYGTIFAVAESPVTPGVIWAGTDDGLVRLTRDGGTSWEDVTPRTAPEWGTVAMIEASREESGTAYVVYDAHRLDDEAPHLWKTTDFGETWKSLAAGLDPETYLHVVRVDPANPKLLYLGTERGVMLSRNDGETWESFRLNMPTVAIADMVVAGDDLVVGSLGRSAWILDDLGPVRTIARDMQDAPLFLFPPRPTAAWLYGDAPDGSRDGAGENPPEGAILTYRLPEVTEEEITLEVLDAGGQLVRRLSSTPEEPYSAADHPDREPDSEDEAALSRNAGLNRAAWDLRYQSPKRVPGARLDYGDPGPGPMVLPGEYTLRLVVGGEMRTQPLTVLPDPRSTTSRADREAQLVFTLEVSAAFERVTERVLQIRSVRDQIVSRGAVLGDDPSAEELRALGAELVGSLDELEARFHNPGAEVQYDILAGRGGGAQLHSRLEWLLLIAREHEGPPTQGMRDWAVELNADLESLERQLDALLGEDLERLNALARERSIGFVVP